MVRRTRLAPSRTHERATMGRCILRDAAKTRAPQDEGPGTVRAFESRHERTRDLLLRRPRRRRARGGAAARQVVGDAGAGGDVCRLHRREVAAAGASGVRLHRGLCRGRHHRRARRLVCGGGAVQAAAGPADPAHRDHPGQPAPHRRQARRIHRGAFPRGGAGRGKTAPGRFRLVHCRLAARPQEERGSRALRAAAVAGSGVGDGDLGVDDLHHPPRHLATACDRSRAARRRHPARLRRGGPASGPARRHFARGASDADDGRNHGGHPRKDPRRIADAAANSIAPTSFW